MVGTPHFHCQGPRFDPWLGKWDPASPTVWPKKEIRSYFLMLLFSRWVVSDFFETPWTVAHQVPCSWDFPGKNTGVGCHSLLWGSSWPTHWTWVSCIGRWILYHWATREACFLLDVGDCIPCWCNILVAQLALSNKTKGVYSLLRDVSTSDNLS